MYRILFIYESDKQYMIIKKIFIHFQLLSLAYDEYKNCISSKGYAIWIK